MVLNNSLSSYWSAALGRMWKWIHTKLQVNQREYLCGIIVMTSSFLPNSSQPMLIALTLTLILTLTLLKPQFTIRNPLEKEMATYSSILAWRTPWTEEPGGLQFMGLDWVTNTYQQCVCINLHLPIIQPPTLPPWYPCLFSMSVSLFLLCK